MDQLAEALRQTQCDVLNIRYSYTGGLQAGFMQVSGTWNAMAKLETQLKFLNQQHKDTIQYQRSQKTEYPAGMIPYIVQVIGVSSPHALGNVTGFFNAQELIMIELAAQHYYTPHTNTAMISIQSTVLIPSNFHLAHIREAFILFCEEHNLDAIFEPDRV